MILIDTSIWCEHLRQRDPRVEHLLANRRVRGHPLVRGEIAMGSLRDRPRILEMLAALPQCRVAEHDDVVAMVERRKLFSRGIGFVDAHLIAGALLTPRCQIWTRDRRFAEACSDLGVGYTPLLN